MKKILVFNGYYIPAKKYGGPTTSLAAIVENCSEDYHFYIVAANHDLNDKKLFEGIYSGWNDVGKAKVLYIDLERINYNSKGINNILQEIKPDMVWLVGILVPAGKWVVAKQCRKRNIPYLISPRGEVCENTFHMKYPKKKIASMLANFFDVYKNAWFHATSEEEKEGLIKYYNACEDRIFLVPNIPSNLYGRKRNIFKQTGELRIVFISRIQEKKNLLFALEVVNKLECDVIFDIYGPIESTEYWKKCEEVIQSSPKNVHISYKGSLTPDDVMKTFEKYHCFLFPTVSENYGHVIVESLSISCPVILSKGTTPWDDLDNKAGYICELNDFDGFLKALLKIADMNNEVYYKFMVEIQKYYDTKICQDNAVEGHLRMINRIITDK